MSQLISFLRHFSLIYDVVVPLLTVTGKFNFHSVSIHLLYLYKVIAHFYMVGYLMAVTLITSTHSFNVDMLRKVCLFIYLSFELVNLMFCVVAAVVLFITRTFDRPKSSVQ